MHKLNRGHTELGILNNAVKEWFSKVFDGIGLSDDLACVCVCSTCVSMYVCVVLPQKSADAASVTEPLACSGHAGRHRWA